MTRAFVCQAAPTLSGKAKWLSKLIGDADDNGDSACFRQALYLRLFPGTDVHENGTGHRRGISQMN